MAAGALMNLSQWWILIFGVGAIWLANERSDHLRRWAPVCGLIGQPAWIIAALEAQQLGVLLVSLLYTLAWARGFWVHWISRAFACWWFGCKPDYERSTANDVPCSRCGAHDVL